MMQPVAISGAVFFNPYEGDGTSVAIDSNFDVGGAPFLDNCSGHPLDSGSSYHYHGIPFAVVGELDGTLFGYDADGFEIHYVGSDAQSSWQLKAGERASGPGGAHDGTYVQDYEFVEGSGTLDEGNGGTLDGQYVYFATDTYPFFPRCFRGTVSSDFIGGRGERPPRDDAGPTPAP